MIRLIISLVALVIAGFAAWGVAWLDQTYALTLTLKAGNAAALPLPQSLSLFTLAAVLALSIALALIGGRVWQFLAALPGRLAERARARQKERGYLALTKGLAAVAAGDARESASFATASKSLLKDQKLTALLTAQSAQLQGREDVAAEEFKALLEDEETAFLGLRGLAMQALRQGREVEALRHVRAAHALRPTAPWVLDLLHRLELHDGNIGASITALEACKAQGHKTAVDVRQMLAPLYTSQALAALEADKTQEALTLSAKALEQAFFYLPAVLIRAQALVTVGQMAQARSLIAKQWGREPHPDLPALYLTASEVQGDARKTRKAGLALLKNNDGSRAAQLALGEFLLKLLDVAGATVALEAAKAKGSPRAAQLIDLIPRLTLILEDSEEGEHGPARQERALALIDAALAGPQDSEWLCASCGTVQGDWGLVCESCGATGTIEWQDRDQRRVRRGDLLQLTPALPSSLT